MSNVTWFNDPILTIDGMTFNEVRSNLDNIDWYNVSCNPGLTLEYIREFQDFLSVNTST